MHYRSAFSLVAAAALAVPSLAGCDSINRALGREKVIPDEFAVVSSAPLAIPPDYSLRPPRVSTTRDQETSPTEQARQSVFRAGEQQQASLPPAQNGRSAGEDELLREAGAGDAPKDIRELVNNDPREGQTLESGFVDKLLFWEGVKTPPSNQVLDPAKEAERLRGTQMAGKAPGPQAPATSTELSGTPTIERTTSKSWFSGWFSWL